jgi:6-phosphogluconolactonase
VGELPDFPWELTDHWATVPGSPFPVAAGSVQPVTDAAGKFLFVVSSSSVSAFTINAASGALIAAAPPVALSALSLPTPGMAATTPTGNFLYVAISSTNSVDTFSFDTATGVLSAVNGPSFPVGTLPLTLTTTAKAVYVSNSLDNTISALAWDPTSGALTPISGSPYAAPWGGGDLVSLRGQYLYVPSINNVFPPNVDAILGFSIGASGALTPLSGSPYAAGMQLWGGLAAQ